VSTESHDSGKYGCAGGGGALGVALLALVRLLYRSEFYGFVLALVAALLLILGVALIAYSVWGIRKRRPGVGAEPCWPLLASLCIGPALVAAGLWIAFGPDWRSPAEQAAAAIERLKGEITRDDIAPNKPIIKVSFRDSIYRLRFLDNADLASLSPHLAALPELRELDLVHTSITDQGLQNLKSLTQLKVIQLGDSWGAHRGVTRDGVEELRKALPQTQVYFHEPPQPLMLDAETLKQFSERMKAR
jgi:hypothetical protein